MRPRDYCSYRNPLLAVLPFELQLAIVRLLRDRERCAARRVCRFWRSVTSRYEVRPQRARLAKRRGSPTGRLHRHCTPHNDSALCLLRGREALLVSSVFMK